MIARYIENKSLQTIALLISSVSLSIISVYFDIVKYIFVLGMFLLFFQTNEGIRDFFKYKSENNTGIPLMLHYCMVLIFGLSIFYVLRIIVRYLAFTANPFSILLLYTLIYLNWKFNLNGHLLTFPQLKILQYQTHEPGIGFYMTTKNTFIPLITITVYFEFRILFKSITQNTPFLPLQIQIIVVLLILILHILVNNLFLGVIHWKPRNGRVKMIQQHIPVQIPSPSNPNLLFKYFKEIFILPEPPETLKSYLQKNLEVLVKQAQEIEYFGFITYFIHAVNNWGKTAQQFLLEYQLIVSSSFCKFLNFGRIQINRRRLFFKYLLSIAKSGQFLDDWRDLLMYEINKGNIYAIDVFGPYQVEKITEDKFKLWNDIYLGYYYAGKQGFEYILKEITGIEQEAVIMENQWEKDAYSLINSIVQSFIGPNAGKIMSDQTGIEPRLKFIAKGIPLQEYKTYKEKLDSKPFTDFHKEITSTTPVQYSQDEAAKVIMKYFGKSTEKNEDTQIGIFQKLRRISPIMMIKYIRLLSINLGLYYIIQQFIGDTTQYLLWLQLLLLLFTSVDNMNRENISKFRQKKNRNISINRRFVYAIVLTVLYIVLLR